MFLYLRIDEDCDEFFLRIGLPWSFPVPNCPNRLFINYSKTGHRSGGLLDIHIVTDEDIARKDSYAMKIGAVTDAARPLSLMKPRQLS